MDDSEESSRAGPSQPILEKWVLLIVQSCWLGLSVSMVLIWTAVTVFYVVGQREPLRGLVGVCGVIATAPGVVHYLRLVLRTCWSLRTRDERRLGVFW